MPTDLEFREQAIQQQHFGRRLDNITCSLFWIWVCAIKEIRVVAAFAQLHEHIVEPDLLARRVVQLLLDQVLIHVGLELRHPRFT